MEREDKPDFADLSAPDHEARVGLLIQTHALPALSYRVPDHLQDKIQPGKAIIAPLSGYSRLGVVVEVTEQTEEQPLEPLRRVAEGLSITPELAEVCRELSDSFAVPLATVLRAAMVPGLNTGRYEVVDPEPDWPWERGSLVGRTTLKRELGGEKMRSAEDEGRIKLTVAPPQRELIEWTRINPGAAPDLSRAPRQREVYEFLAGQEDGCQTSTLLSETGASRNILRELVRRGAVSLEERVEPPPVRVVKGNATSEKIRSFVRDAGRVVDRGGAWSWRVATREHPPAVAAFAKAAIEGGEQVLVLAPEVESVERLVDYITENLSGDHTVAPYHSGLEKKRAAVYEAFRDGDIEVLVGTRTAALLPMKCPGAICVVDEPDLAHRAEPGYEGLPVHVREIALERWRAEDCCVLFLSPCPSLRIAAPESRIKELPAPRNRGWPAARIVDMRGSGAMLSSAMLEACSSGLTRGKRIAVLANRLGYATSVSCSQCGAVQTCPNCDLPLALRESSDVLNCKNCGYRAGNYVNCEACGSGRLRPAGFAVDRLREELARALDVPIGKLTADAQEHEDTRLVASTARFVTGADWDIVAIPDADAWLFGGDMSATEQAFRLLYGASEAARDLILVQTRQPVNYTLRAALRGDYPSFAAAELPRLRRLGYPPYGHLAALVLEGKEESVRRAVELRLRPSLEPGVSMSEPVPAARYGDSPGWRVLLRARDQKAAARAAANAARLAARTRGSNALVARVEVDPEEV